MNSLAALYVLRDGPYNLPGIDLWDEKRDARKYRGPYPVVAHPPCERWGRYWGGGPMLHGTPNQKLMGDDGGCFAHALWAVRTFGGVLEHPEASHAWAYYGLPRPARDGGWTEPDKFGGRACCVAQGHYGHSAQKLTWLYGVNIDFRELTWGPALGKIRLEAGFHSSEARKLAETTNVPRISARERDSRRLSSLETY
jgi:hypothetical protein